MLHNYKMATVQVSKVEPVIPVSNILKNVLHKIYSSLIDPDGRYVILDIDINGTEISIKYYYPY